MFYVRSRGRVLLDFVCGDVVRSTSRDIDRGTFEVGRVVFSREQRAHEWDGADVLRWKPIQLWRKGLRTTDDGKNGHGRPSDTYIKSNQTTLGDRPRGRSFQLELWTAHVALLVRGDGMEPQA